MAAESSEVSLTIKLLNGDEIMRDERVALSMKVDDLKKRAECAAGCHIDDLLSPEGRKLDSSVSIGDVGLRDGIVMTAVVTEMLNIHFLVLPGEFTREMGGKVIAAANCTAKTLAKMIEEELQEEIYSMKAESLSTESCIIDDDRTLLELGFTDGQVVLVEIWSREPVDDIGVFGYHAGSPGIQFLTTGALPISTDIQHIISKVGGLPDAEYYSSPDVELVGPSERAALIRHMDLHWNGEADFKLDLTCDRLIYLIGEDAVAKLSEFFSGTYNQIKLRRCMEQGKCINFHTDISRRTMQVALNGDEDYAGGRLVYVTGRGLSIPRRPPGSVIIHGNSIAHGVSRLEAGVRYGLFLLQG